jgi:peptidyl-prolyl cis-trans isomerase SurA
MKKLRMKKLSRSPAFPAKTEPVAPEDQVGCRALAQRMRIALIALIALAAAASGLQAQVEPSPNGIAVVVNNSVITYYDIIRGTEKEVQLLETQYANQPNVLMERIDKLQRDRTEQLVENKLILHEFETAGYNLPESVIDDVVQSHIRQDYGDRFHLIKHLELEGRTYDDYRNRIREQFIVQQMRLKNVSSDVFVSPYKIQTYYRDHQDQFREPDQIRLRMIVIDKAKHGAYLAKELAREILTKLQEGAPFADMAAIYNDGKQPGGDYGWVDRSGLRQDLANVAFKLKPGQHTDVIDTRDGCYLMEAQDRRPAHVKPLAQVRDEIEHTLKTRETNQLTQRWINRLREKSFIAYIPVPIPPARR